MSPESLLLLHHAMHAELLAELRAGRRGGSRRLRRAADAVARAFAVRGSAQRRIELSGRSMVGCVVCA
ncbi:hypothetical protein [Actinotalea fermentans]|uniref:Uncharacterized protein n=1 Tax=Actinotalea fermentans TaxID=43671 RepID=A0A511Z1D0_9CELL|nr:hypothetical protein [Actinotalea fermentans]GEN81270.1 hypothetical protein AFE02nite_30040 [Actinotalea fermentans]